MTITGNESILKLDDYYIRRRRALQMEFYMLDSTLVVVLMGEIDHHTCVAIRQAVDRNYQKKRAKNLLFDFEKVTFMDSSGIGMLMGRYRLAAIGGGRTGLYNVPKDIERILNMSNVCKLMKAYSNKQEALKELA